VAPGSLRLIDSCITQRKAQGPSRTYNESKEEEEHLEAQDVRGEVEGDAADVLVRQEQRREVHPVRVFVPEHVGLPTARALNKNTTAQAPILASLIDEFLN